jgi:dethiobiotin synthetase
MSSFFITGTDTDIGKTIVTTLLAAYFQKQGKHVIPYKPIQSGAIEDGGKLVAPDIQIYQLAFPKLNEEEANTYLLKMPSSPHLASREDGVNILSSKIIQHFRLLEQKYDMVLVEGAGGLIVPLHDNGYCMIDLIKALSIPVVLVARAGLGTINHTVLSVMAMRNAGIPIAGIILNQVTDGDSSIEQDNKRMIEHLTNVPIIGMIPYLKNVEELIKNDRLLDRFLASQQFENLKEIEGNESTGTSRK